MSKNMICINPSLNILLKKQLKQYMITLINILQVPAGAQGASTIMMLYI